MAQINPNNFHTFNPTKIAYDTPRKNNNGGTAVNFKYDGEELLLQGPKGRAPFGVSSYSKDPSKPANLSLQITFDEESAEYLKVIQALDKNHVHAAASNVKGWFSRPLLPHQVEVLYKKTPQQSKNPEKYRPTIRYKINRDTQFFDENKQPMSVDMIKPGSLVIPVCKTATLWFTNGNFQPQYLLLQARVFEPPTQLNGYSIMDFDDE